jgi:hypothetical protein
MLRVLHTVGAQQLPQAGSQFRAVHVDVYSRGQDRWGCTPF